MPIGLQRQNRSLIIVLDMVIYASYMSACVRCMRMLSRGPHGVDTLDIIAVYGAQSTAKLHTF